MTSGASWLNPALLKENFKRFWPVTMVSFLFWLVCGPFVLVLSSDGNGFDYFIMEDILGHRSPAPIMLNFLLPIAMAVLCFNYLHRTNSTGVVHAMPFSRRSLFVTNYVSGLLMAVLPAAVTSVILLCMLGGVQQLSSQPPLTAVDVLRFLAEEFTVISFVYAIAVFAGVICGLSVIHSLTAAALNFICPVLYILMMGYLDVYAYGYSDADNTERILSMSPYMKVLEDGWLSGKDIAMYLLIAAAVTLAAYGLYRVRKLERAGESYVFRSAKYIIGFLMVFICSSLTGFVFREPLGFGAYVMGFAVGYVVSQMIVNRSTKIFTKECLASGLAYAAVIALIVCAFRFDLVGYEKRVPDASRVEKATVYCSIVDLGMDGLADELTDPEDIALLTAVHRTLAENPDYGQNEGYYNSSPRDYDYSTSVYIHYVMKGGKTMSRRYWVNSSVLRGSDEMRTLWNNSRANGLQQILRQFGAVNTEITLEGYRTDPNGNPDYVDYWEEYEKNCLNMGTSRLAEKEALLNALRLDAAMMEYDNLFVDYSKEPYVSVNLDCREPADPNAPEEYSSGDAWTYYDYDDIGRPSYRHLCLRVNATKYYVNTVEALLQTDISDDLREIVESID